MTDRYFVVSPIERDRATLTDSEAHHLAHVMRLEKGDPVTLFDGRGAEFDGRVERIGRRDVEVKVLSRREVDRELARRVTIGVALPKGDRQRWIVEKLTELGVARLVPLTVTRGVAAVGDNALRRLRRAVIEASKQCGRNTLMEVTPAVAWSDYLADSAAAGRRLLAHPRGAATAAEVIAADPPGDVTAAIGPEGGLTDEEVAQAVDAGWECVDLGSRILRTETAALCLAVCLGLPRV